MQKKFQKYIIKCTIIIILMPAITFISGCGNDADADVPSFRNAENAEYEGYIGYEKSDGINIEDDAAEIQEAGLINASENPDIDLEADSDAYNRAGLSTANEVNFEPAEIYERFLDGELMVELEPLVKTTSFREKEQVTISGLFWDNDIEYCFLDIDNDGGEELHIRDNVVYYVIKAVDGTPQILFEGWWSYEPVVTDEQCGILHYYNGGYGYEQLEFIRISADGSTENDGAFKWDDGNENGSMDAEDSFTVYIGYDDSLGRIAGFEDIDMEQYIRYKKEHSAQQAGYELKWTQRRLKEFETWQEAYLDFLQKPSATIWVSGSGFEDYSLIYIDDDDIPELYIYTGGAAIGEIIVSFYEGKVRAMERTRGGIRYIEYAGLLYSNWGNMGFYPCNIYMLEKGEFSEIGTGWLAERYDEETAFLDYAHFWEGKEVTETEYEECINELIDTSKCIEPSLLYTKDEILEILAASLLQD